MMRPTSPPRLTPPVPPVAPSPNGSDPAAHVRPVRVVLATWTRRRDNFTVLWGQRPGQPPQVLAEWRSRQVLYDDWYALLDREAQATPRDTALGQTVQVWSIVAVAGQEPVAWYAGPPLRAEERVVAVIICEPDPDRQGQGGAR